MTYENICLFNTFCTVCPISFVKLLRMLSKTLLDQIPCVFICLPHVPMSNG